MDKKLQLFTLIICTYNGAKNLDRVIAAILAQDNYSQLVADFIIVNNNSSDATAETIAQYIPQVSVIFEPRQGLAYARLAGTKLVKSEWVIFIDDDNLLSADWLVQAAEFIQANPNLGAFNGAVIPLIESKLSQSAEENLAICYRRLACSHLSMSEVAPVSNHIPIGAGLVIRNTTLQKLINQGWTKRCGRNGSSLFGGEDIEMSLFTLTQGYEFGFCTQMFIYHLIPAWRLERNYLINLYRHNDVELELRSARFGIWADAYLIFESITAVITYYFRRFRSKSPRITLFEQELRKEQALAYLMGLCRGKRLPNTIKSMLRANINLSKREFH